MSRLLQQECSRSKLRWHPLRRAVLKTYALAATIKWKVQTVHYRCFTWRAFFSYLSAPTLRLLWSIHGSTYASAVINLQKYLWVRNRTLNAHAHMCLWSFR